MAVSANMTNYESRTRPGESPLDVTSDT
jgi:hypothetical protein